MMKTYNTNPAGLALPLMLRLFALLALASGSAAHATSPQEETMFKAPMPHQSYSGGAQVKVHRARLEGYFEGKNGNAAAIDDLKRQVRECVKAMANSPNPVRPPTVWPDYMQAHREDSYTAANRSIRYTSDVGYVVSNLDCSLMSQIESRAELVSSKGVCKIDLARKTARGDCDSNGHADAPLAKRAPAQPPPEVLKRLAANPAFAAAMPQMQKVVANRAVKGAQRTILGVRCNVWNQPVDDDGTVTTLCYAVGGSFLPPRAVDQDGFGGLLLESTTPHGYQLKAVAARLDTEVGNAVFAPYAGAGYTINGGTP
jgi:hypothetical protein